MRKLSCLIGAAILIAGGVLAEENSYIPLQIINISTSAPSTNTYPIGIRGEVKKIVLNWGGAVNPTGDVHIATDGGYFGVPQTLYSVVGVTADATEYVRTPPVFYDGSATTNTHVPIVLMGSTVSMTVSNINQTNVTLNAYVILEKK